MATRSEIREWADERFDGWAKRQERWIKHFGEYCQLLHEPTLPDGDTEKSGTLDYGKPGDRPWNGEEFFKLGARKTKLKREAEAKEREEEGSLDKRESIELRLKATAKTDDDASASMSRRQTSVAFDVHEDESGKSWTMRASIKQPNGKIFELVRHRDDKQSRWREIVS